MNISFRLFFGVCIQGLLGLQQAYATTYYVSPSGVDTNSGTSLSTPIKTINRALNKAQSSGDIVYVMTGTYMETVYIGQSGITLSAYPNNQPVIDGGNSLPNSDWGVLISVDGNNNTVSGFEVKNSNMSGTYLGGYGIQVAGHNNTIGKMNVHHTSANGILINGDYNIVEDSTVWQTNQSNAKNPGSGWGSGLSSARNNRPEALISGISSYAILRRNTVFNNWGEGLSCYEADHCTVEDNIIYDNYAVNLYISDTTNDLVQRNIVYVSLTPAIIIANPTGITLADEVSTVPRSANNTIINNFLYNSTLDAFSWTIVPNSGLRNVLIANNTIVDGGLTTGVGGNPSIVNTNSQIRNNIIIGQKNNVPSNSGITFSNNNWSTTPPAAASSTDIVGDPQIARTGSTATGALTSAYFKILGSSPVINAAMPLASVTTDFFLTSRGSAPDIGGYEFNSSAPTPTPAPAPVPVPVPPPSTVDSTAPLTSITSPANASSVAVRSNITIQAKASDNVGVKTVSFYVNGSLKCTVSAAPYKCVWRVPRNRGKTYSLQTKAYDAAGNVGISSLVIVTSK